MEFVKEQLCTLESCYAVSVMELDGRPWYFAASEAAAPCVAFDAEEPSRRLTVWETPGGCMSMVPIPGRAGEFLAIQRFFGLFQWEGAEVAWIFRNGDRFERKTLVRIPYIHRIDVLEGENCLWFLGCSVSNRKDSLDDWRVGGRVYTARLDPDARTLEGLSMLRDDLFQNHGYCRLDGGRGLIGCAQGIFRISPPAGKDGWTMERIFDQPVSDMALADLDGDGVPELATIEPFHGQWYRVYRRTGEGWTRIYEHPEVTEFYHVVWGGELNGIPAFLGGCRRGKQQLFCLTWEEQRGVVCRTIDEGGGPSNVAVHHRPAGDVIVTANREQGEAVLYRTVGAR